MKNLLVILAMLVAVSASGQWTQTSLQNIKTECLSICYGNIYSGTTDSGIYVSTNNGLNWNKTSFINTRVLCIYQFKNKIFAGTSNLGIFVSADSGRNWTQTILNNQYVTSITSDSTNIYASDKNIFSTTRGIFKSSNNGTNWIQVLNVSAVGAMLFVGNNLLATLHSDPIFVSPNGMFYSTNYGSNWIQSNSSATAYCYMKKDSLVYAGIGVGHYIIYGVRMSTDYGVSWQVLTVFNNKSVLSMGYSNNYLFAATSDQGVYTSNNNFATWQRVNQGLGDTILNSLLVKDGYIFVATRDHGVWKRALSEITGIQNISTETPSKYSLSQNYPNPFNPVTIIRFSIPAVDSRLRGNDRVLLKVYDILGKEVQTLVNESLQPGTYETSFDGSSLTSGVYFYRLITNEFAETKKMLLIK